MSSCSIGKFHFCKSWIPDVGMINARCWGKYSQYWFWESQNFASQASLGTGTIDLWCLDTCTNSVLQGKANLQAFLITAGFTLVQSAITPPILKYKRSEFVLNQIMLRLTKFIEKKKKICTSNQHRWTSYEIIFSWHCTLKFWANLFDLEQIWILYILGWSKYYFF
jgi:hypothetical protein